MPAKKPSKTIEALRTCPTCSDKLHPSVPTGLRRNHCDRCGAFLCPKLECRRAHLASHDSDPLIRWNKILSGLHGESTRGAVYIIERGFGGGFYWCTGPKTKEFYGRHVDTIDAGKEAAEALERKRSIGFSLRQAISPDAKTSSLPRGMCAACGNDVALRTNGTAREHRGRAVNGKWPRVCAGSGVRAQRPTTSASSASSAQLHKKPSPASSSSRKVPAEIPSSATLRQQFVKCGKGELCGDCTDGKGHGPYWYAAWKENGRTRSKYLGRELAPELLARRQAAEDKPADMSRPTRKRVRDEKPIDASQLKPGIPPPPKFRKKKIAARARRAPRAAGAAPRRSRRPR